MPRAAGRRRPLRVLWSFDAQQGCWYPAVGSCSRLAAAAIGLRDACARDDAPATRADLVRGTHLARRRFA